MYLSPFSYKQRRFNLFREETEGFAKLITELNLEFEDNTTSESIMDIIKSLIGKELVSLACIVELLK